MANSITVVGRLTADAEVRKGKSDFMTFSLADDAAKDSTIFHDCICFDDRLVGVIAQYLTKGKPIFVSGRLEDNTYENKDGVTIRRNQVIVTNINFVGGDKKEEGSSQGKQQQQRPASSSSLGGGGFDDDDDVPF